MGNYRVGTRGGAPAGNVGTITLLNAHLAALTAAARSNAKTSSLSSFESACVYTRASVYRLKGALAVRQLARSAVPARPSGSEPNRTGGLR